MPSDSTRLSTATSWPVHVERAVLASEALPWASLTPASKGELWCAVELVGDLQLNWTLDLSSTLMSRVQAPLWANLSILRRTWKMLGAHGFSPMLNLLH